MTIPYVNLGAQYAEEREGLLARIDSVLSSGIWIGGEVVEKLEAEFASYLGVKHAVSLNSGTDALVIALLAAGVGKGDEVISPPNSFAATVASIVAVGATPVFADVDYDELILPQAVEAAITPRTAAVIPVHLRGSVCRMTEINEIARKHGLAVIEDAAQSFGSKLSGIQSGALGDVGCFSLHPLKGLNACGDAGMLVTNSESIATYARLHRNHGLVNRDTVARWGTVSRLDPIQAAIVLDRLARIESVFQRRRRNASIYHDVLGSLPLRLTSERADEFHTYNTFVLQTPVRDELQASLAAAGIASNVHYKIPLHLQEAAAGLYGGPGQFPVTEELSRIMLSVPIHQCHGAEDISLVANSIADFFSDRSNISG